MEPCPICETSAWDPLTNPQRDRAMLSDLRVIAAPLDKWICRTCAVVRRFAPPAGDLFSSGYSLYDHPPGSPREVARQDVYASWIASQFSVSPRSVLDAGCGNGSLLMALMRLWPEADMHGIDPSRDSTARARAMGIDARAEVLGEHAESVQLVISVNVIEHTLMPAEFARSAAGALAPDGELILICPDGRHPWTELLIADHCWSFAPWHLEQLLERAGIQVVSISVAPAELGPFVMVRGTRAPGGAVRASAPRVPTGLAAEKIRYLGAWSKLDAILRHRVSTDVAVCFGIGEAAALLRAYAPNAWSCVRACTADDPERVEFGDLPVNDYRLTPPTHVLLGVRPSAQASVAARLRADGHEVIRWDDVIAA